ncbi:MAG: sulfotransferase [Candidatus Sulfotelmatobacter sp.]
MSVDQQYVKSRENNIERSRRVASDGGTVRNTAPVFVVGCPRSGTTLLYHMLLSAGGFANYRSESNVFNLLLPKFAGLRSAADRKALLNVWLKSKLFRVSGLDPDAIAGKIIDHCKSAGDFLRIVMQEIARNQGVARWADCTPEHLLYMQEIKRQIPDALFIHLIRDGRDVALSYVKQGWTHPFPWDSNYRLGVAGLYWEWLVRKGREQVQHLGSDYCEVRFEDLVANPQESLTQLESFIDHELDYERIRRVGIGSVSQPNTSFSAETGASFHPVERWRTKMTAEEIAAFEEIAGGSLTQLGYELSSAVKPAKTLHAARMRATYLPLFEVKHWARAKTPLRRLVSLERIEIEQ